MQGTIETTDADCADHRMGPARMKAIREQMHLQMRVLARWSNRAEGTLRAMETGERPIPKQFGDWLAALGQWLDQNPPPNVWLEYHGPETEWNPISESIVLAGAAAENRRSITPARMVAIREQIDLPMRSLSRWTERSWRKLQAMEAGKQPIPPRFGKWFDDFGNWVAENPPPETTAGPRAVVTPFGHYASIALASAAAGISRQHGWLRVRSGEWAYDSEVA